MGNAGVCSREQIHHRIIITVLADARSPVPPLDGIPAVFFYRTFSAQAHLSRKPIGWRMVQAQESHGAWFSG